MSRLLSFLTLALVAFPLLAERIRVVVALDEPPAAMTTSVADRRASVVSSLATATAVEPWGEWPAFGAEIDRVELEALRRDPRVRSVAIDEGGTGSLLESIPVIGADQARALGFDGRGVTVAVLDTGIDAANADFGGRVIAERCFCDNLDGSGCCPNGDLEQAGPGSAADDNGHGTHVTGIIAGGGAKAPRGVAPAALIVAVKVMDRSNGFKSFTQVYRGLQWIVDNHPQVGVINMSLGSWALFTGSECHSAAIGLAMRGVIDALRARGVLITVSSGNQGSTTSMALPACMNEVLAVGATYDADGSYDHTRNYNCADVSAYLDQVTCFTNSSESLDLLAPGSRILSTRLGGGSVTYNGTSMAAPHVAGAIALMLQAGGRMPAAQIEQILKQSGTLVTDMRNGVTSPRVNVAAALAATPRAAVPPRRRAVRAGRH